MISWTLGTLAEANELLATDHYLGPIRSGGYRAVVIGRDEVGWLVACQVWRNPTSRRLPNDGTWLELSRWCLTPGAGINAGSRMHATAVKLLRELNVTTLVSYSDPAQGHTGALYRACNWVWCPTWHRLRPPPTGHGDWGTGQQGVKDRWVFPVAPDARRSEILSVRDAGAIRRWRATATQHDLNMAKKSFAPDLVEASQR